MSDRMTKVLRNKRRYTESFSIFLWARALVEISYKVCGQIGTYCFFVPFLTVLSSSECTYVDSTVQCPFTKIVPIVRSGSSKGSQHGISVDLLLVQRICS
jgi:hypothetical protein